MQPPWRQHLSGGLPSETPFHTAGLGRVKGTARPCSPILVLRAASLTDFSTTKDTASSSTPTGAAIPATARAVAGSVLFSARRAVPLASRRQGREDSARRGTDEPIARVSAPIWQPLPERLATMHSSAVRTNRSLTLHEKFTGDITQVTRRHHYDDKRGLRTPFAETAPRGADAAGNGGEVRPAPPLAASCLRPYRTRCPRLPCMCAIAATRDPGAGRRAARVAAHSCPAEPSLSRLAPARRGTRQGQRRGLVATHPTQCPHSC